MLVSRGFLLSPSLGRCWFPSLWDKAALGLTSRPPFPSTLHLEFSLDSSLHNGIQILLWGFTFWTEFLPFWFSSVFSLPGPSLGLVTLKG